jgi:hypothetical protein
LGMPMSIIPLSISSNESINIGKLFKIELIRTR